MKRLIASLLLAAIVATGAAAQGRGPDSGKMIQRLQAEKVAFLTSALDLTPAEAQVFWPVYNEAEKQMRENFKAGMEGAKALKDAIDAGKSDAEIEPLLSAWIASRSHNALEAHKDDFIKVIGAAKTARLYIAEEEFRNNQIRRLSQRRGNGPEREQH